MDFVKGEMIYYSNIYNIGKIDSVIFDDKISDTQILVKNEEGKYDIIHPSDIVDKEEEGAKYFALPAKLEKLEKLIKQVRDEIKKIEGKL